MCQVKSEKASEGRKGVTRVCKQGKAGEELWMLSAKALRQEFACI